MHQMFGDEFLRVLEKYYFGEATKEEVQHIERQLRSSSFARELWEDLQTTMAEQGLTPHTLPRKRINSRALLSAAALLLLLVFTAYLAYKPRPELSSMAKTAPTDTVYTTAVRKHVELQAANGGSLALTGNGHILDTTRNPVSMDSILQQYVNTAYATANNVLDVPWGETYAAKLPNGIAAYINSGTHLKFPLFSKGQQDEIFLEEGEVFFKKPATGGRPFIIHTGKGDIVGHGTSLNVRFYDGVLTVSSVSGLVAVVNTQGQTMQLTPGQQAVSQSGQNTFTKEPFIPGNTLAWLDGKQLFNNAPLPEVCRIIQRAYNIPVTIDNLVLQDKRLTGMLVRSTKLETVLANLCEVGNMHWRIDQQHVLHFSVATGNL